ncbi:hypothetical protein E4U43_007647 [Claviceps pusilla]|uniref:DUF4045 domain-containing protein n=1 Tax=Claviceps pusilla TaxID=123648 RepID=A0A9P7T1E7_9HYPO|nr:hypothetical protein E4U43_007647 [Claviceps pusilla]
MSDEVSQFLEQVERLRGQQIEDDAARAREREEFLAAKRERQARREERARSISPQKSSPMNTPSPHSNRQSVQTFETARFRSPSRMGQDRERSDTPSVDPDDPIQSPGRLNKEKEAVVDAETTQTENSTPLIRTSTLSWQRRPASRGGVRPLSMVAAQNATQKSLIDMQTPASATEETFSKDQISKALGSKDPSWFRQTADRGQGSAAYRRTQVEDENRSDMSSASAQLPGLSAADSDLENGSRSKPDLEEPHHSQLASPVTLKPAPIDGASEDAHRVHELSNASATSSPSRSPSPTKGLGGFVQSAMMKRSDSVKRWSVTSPPGLTRADSIAAARAYDRSSVQAGPRQQNTTRESSTTPTSSRPTSYQGDIPLELKLSSKDSAGNVRHGNERDEEIPSTPTSPFKATEPRRWSPNKSSWLESALNKPESPKSVTSPTTPTWREKAAMESSRPTSVSHKHQVSIGGLLRQSALGSVAKSNPTGLGGIYSPPPNANRPAYGHGSKPSVSQKTIDLDAPQSNDAATHAGKSTASIEQSTVAESGRRTPTMSPPLKPKPETPPAKDFRSNLRQRPAEKEPPKSDEPEFKNVFGNLRRTKVQNFVAPDELKDNILRGKAGLHSTDGPKKSEKKDEFKDAILKKRADFKTAQVEGRGVTRTPSDTSEKSIPEGIARRATLSSRSVATTAKRFSVSESPKTASTKPSPGPKNVSSGAALSSISPNTVQPPPLATTSTTTSGTEQLRRVAAESQAVKVNEADGARAPPGLHKETSASSKLSTPGRVGAGSGKLADRFNPALAGLLAKGPPGMSTNGGRDADGSREHVSSKGGESTEPSVSVPQLTHMTKNRARGPKRKAPTSSTPTAPAVSPSHVGIPSASATSSETAPLKIGSDPEPLAAQPPQDEITTEASAVSPSKERPADFPAQDQVASEARLPSNASPSSNSDTEPPEPTQFSEAAANAHPASRGRPQVMGPRVLTSTSPAKTGPRFEDDGAPSPTSPKKLDMKRMSRFFDVSPIHNVEQEPSRELLSQRTGSRSPSKLAEPPSPTKSDRDSLPSMRAASPAAKPSSDEPATTGGFDRRSRPLSGLSTEGLKSPAASASPTRSQTKQANEVSAILSDFFGPPQTRQAMNFDPAQILMNRPETGGKITSLGLQMFQILGDGKKLPVSTQHERVLFDQEMYVCAHNFANQSGKKVFEVYFWVGDEVPESTAEDAQLFVQREARSLGGKLVKLQQGKETAEFVQALGGVIIVRKGSSNKYDSLAPYMLCGRRYLGQVAFDEVDASPSNLCAGFAYLLGKGGHCYLWKGKGSDVTEVSCARLVGMDLTLLGELVECEDGSEPSSFWDLFDDKSSKPHSADHWRLKPSYEKYCSRLFCSDADSRQQIYEISPFNQADLSSASIYILDAFFEIYIIVGSRANSQYSSFRNALDFAQEYAILASGMEDRPFVPISTVVLEGIPRDLKRVFRKWDDRKSPTVTNTAGAGAGSGSESGSGLKRGRSLRVVSLTQALQALTD